MKKILMILILAVLLMAGCQPAKKVTRNVTDNIVLTGRKTGEAGQITGRATSRGARVIARSTVFGTRVTVRTGTRFFNRNR